MYRIFVSVLLILRILLGSALYLQLIDSMTIRLGHREQKDEWVPRLVDVFQKKNVLPPTAIVSAGSANSACTAGTLSKSLVFNSKRMRLKFDYFCLSCTQPFVNGIGQKTLIVQNKLKIAVLHIPYGKSFGASTMG